MQSIKSTWIMIALAIVIVCFGIGKLIDRNCEGGCLNKGIHETLAKNNNNFEIFGGNFHVTGDDDIEHKGESHVGGDLNAEVPPLDGVEKIEIQSVSTDWQLRVASDKASLDLRDARSGQWSMKKDGSRLVIQIKPGGAENAELALPPSFKGKLFIKTVSGDLDIGEIQNLTDLQIDSASGEINLSTWPSESLEVNTVSGSLRASAAISIPQVKDATIHSVSADVDLEMKAPLGVIHTQTVSGVFSLAVPKDSSFAYEMHSMSGSFDGLTNAADVKESFASRELKGKMGSDAETKAKVHFESVSGDFMLRTAS